MKFSDFVGNQQILAYFRKAIAHAHLGHAYLFSGPDGVGKATLARVLCNALVCLSQSPEDGACGCCSACLKFETGNHADFHPYVPEGTYFKIDQVRSIIHQVSYKPVEAKWKLFLLEGVEYLRDEGSNALLKVLEEPPGETIFFLVAASPEPLLPTIRSRCQHFPLAQVDQQEIVEYLVRRMEVPRDEAVGRARYSHGSLGRALAVNVEQYREMRDRVLAVLESALLPRTYYQLFEAIKGITVERAEMAERFLILEELTRDLLVLKTEPGAARYLIHEDAAQRMAALAAKASLAALQSFYEELLQAREAVLKVNANAGIALQSLLLPLRLVS